MPKAVKRAPASNGAAIQVTVGRRRWTQVSDLVNSGPSARDFAVTRSPDGGSSTVQFGDGIHGARPPVDGEIAVRYQMGGGTGGNTMTVILQRTVKSPTPDQQIWVAIRNRKRAIRIEFVERRRRRPAEY